MPSEQMLVINAIQGIVIAVSFAFLILLVATGNLIQSIASILCVTMVIVSITASFQLNGQQLGIVESIAVVVLIGFSVDYIVHFSAEYMHSREKTRSLKMRQSYRQMGISIFSGYMTTVGSGIWLLLCQLSFFYKFGQTISLTVTFAFLTATLTFGAMMHTFGPEGD